MFVGPTSSLQEKEPTMDVIIVLVILIQHCRSNVRHITPSIALTGHVNLEFLDSKDALKVLKEINKVPGRLLFSGSSRCACRKPRPNGLINPIVKIKEGIPKETIETYHNMLVRFTQEYGLMTGA